MFGVLAVGSAATARTGGLLGAVVGVEMSSAWGARPARIVEAAPPFALVDFVGDFLTKQLKPMGVGSADVPPRRPTGRPSRAQDDDAGTPVALAADSAARKGDGPGVLEHLS